MRGGETGCDGYSAGNGRGACAGLGAFLVSLALLGAGCSPAPRTKVAFGKETDRLEVLTTFTLAVSKRDFHSATLLIDPSERGLFLDDKGIMRAEFQERLRAMRRTTLMNNPAITVSQGRILGIYGVMPMLEHGTPANVATEESGADSAGATVEVSTEDSMEVSAGAEADLPAEAGHDGDKDALRKAADTFFQSVRAGKWNQALGLVNAREKEAFVRPDGKLKEGTRQRLSAIDTSSWEALALEEGKLSGVILLIPATAP